MDIGRNDPRRKENMKDFTIVVLACQPVAILLLVYLMMRLLKQRKHKE